jgi:hypothetical protein
MVLSWTLYLSALFALVKADASATALQYDFDDPRVKLVSPISPAWGSELDWNYTTTPQIYANNSKLQYHAGRDLGGSSTLNGKKNVF